MAKLGNRARMTVSSTGTGPVTLNLAVAGFQTFLDAGLSDSDQVRYVIEDASNGWEIGIGTLSNSSTVMARSVEESSNSGNPLNLTSAAEVFCGVTASDLDNAAPIFTTTPPTELILKKDGTTAVTLNGKAYDESGIPVQYSWDSWLTGGTTIYDASSLPPQLASAPSINQSTGVYSLVGSSNSSNFGTVNFRIKASDGVKVATHVTQLFLQSDPVTISAYTASNAGSIAASATGLIDATTANALISSNGTLPTDALKGGKQYFEVKCLSTYSSPTSGHPELWIGIADTTAAHSNSVGYNTSTKNWCFLRGSGQVGRNGTYSVTSSGWTSTSVWAAGDPRTNTSVGFDDGDVIMFAYDTTAKRVWIGLNGQWCDALGGDPGTSTGAAGTSYNDLSGVNNADPDNTFCLVIGNQRAVVNVDMQIQTGTNFPTTTYNPPTGFDAY